MRSSLSPLPGRQSHDRLGGRSGAALIALLSLSGVLASAQSDCPKRLVGTWEYRQAAGDRYDDQGERIELRCSGHSLQGLYFGLEREGEHGLFYTAVEMKNVKGRANGEVSFTVPARDLFHQRPKTFENEKN